MRPSPRLHQAGRKRRAARHRQRYSPENVGQYLPVADCFLVATGISKSFIDLDPVRVTVLLHAARGA